MRDFFFGIKNRQQGSKKILRQKLKVHRMISSLKVLIKTREKLMKYIAESDGVEGFKNYTNLLFLNI